MNLKCNKANCEHNCKFSCNAKEVHIARNTDCKTFRKDANKTEEQLLAMKADMFELSNDMLHYKGAKDIDIKCKADCVFNNNGNCNANGITVLEKNTDGICGTYIKS